MTGPAPAASAAGVSREAPASPSTLVLVAVLAVATVAAVVASQGHLVVALVPVALATLAVVVARVPLRATTAALLFGLLGVDDTSELLGQWRTPLAKLGDVLHGKLDEVAHVPGLGVTGTEVVLVALLGVWMYRRATGNRVDARGQQESASILVDVVVLYVAAVLFAIAHGAVRGLPVAPWKVRNLLTPALLAFLFLAAFRGPLDHRIIGRVVVASAVARALLALFVQYRARAETGGNFATATSHGDSILFAVAAFLLVIDFLEHPGRRRVLVAGPLLAVILAGTAANERRLAWVMLAAALVLAYLVRPMAGWKRSATRLAVVTLPIVALYVGVGWNREGLLWKPIRLFRSVSDTSIDHSAYWREVENWNIAMTLRTAPLLGLGLGGEYTEYMANDDISTVYKEYRQWPHNTVLGLTLLMGVFAFTAIWALPAVVLFLAVRTCRRTSSPGIRVAALGCLAAVVSCQVMAYGDTGAHYPQYKVFLALAVAVAARASVQAGAWPARRRARAA